MHKTLLISALAILILILALSWLFRGRQQNQSRQMWQKVKIELRKKGQATEAEVYQIINGPKQFLIAYKYNVDGKTYSGSADYQLNKEKLRLGDSIQILYLPDYPDTSMFVEDVNR
jgi:hypothetical protein